MLKYTLIPEGYFSEEAAYDLLSQVVILEKTDSVKSLELPFYKAVLLYAGNQDEALALSEMLAAAAALPQYNKVLAHMGEKVVDIVVAAGDRLLLCNTYPAADAVTAQYYLFAALRQFQINPEVTTVHFYGEVAETVKSKIGFTPLVYVVELGFLPRSEKKSKRVIDERFQ